MGQWSDKRRVHFPSVETLADGALALDEVEDRYLLMLGDRPHEDWTAALRAAGFSVIVDYENNRFVVYRISRVR